MNTVEHVERRAFTEPVQNRCKICDKECGDLRECTNCWEVEHRLKDYLMSAKGRELVNKLLAGFPRYRHDCKRCVFLGRFKDEGSVDGEKDLYFCQQPIGIGGPTVNARYGDEGSQYLSGLGFQSPPLVEAEKRARARGFLE